MPRFTARMNSQKNWLVICRTGARNANHDVDAHRVALFFRRIGRFISGPATSKPAKHSAKAMRDHDISQRRACRLVGVDPKTVRRDKPPDNPEVRKEMKAIANKRRRFGYRRIGVMLERKGMIMDHKKLYRLYTEEKLVVRRRRGRKRARGSRTPMPMALRPGQRWSLDFLSDTFGTSRKFRILAVNDDCCRENLCLMADTSISGARVARELDALVRIYGKPASIASDNVPCSE